MSVVDVGEIQLVSGAGVHSPAVAVANPFRTSTPIGESAIVGAGDDRLAGVEDAAADLDPILRVEPTDIEKPVSPDRCVRLKVRVSRFGCEALAPFVRKELWESSVRDPRGRE